MARIRLRYVNAFRDRHGRLRFYFRRPGFKSVPLPGAPGSTEFMDAYQAALAGAPRVVVGAYRHKPGTVATLVLAYMHSPAFFALADETKRTRRNILQNLVREHGDKRVALLHREHVQQMVSAKTTTPFAARNFLNTLRALMVFAVEAGIRDDDPTLGVKRAKARSDGFRTWSEDDIAAFEAKHPIGTRARLALALLLYTAQRRSDVVGMGRQHIRNGAIEVRQQKTGASLAIPIHFALKAVLDATPSEHLTFLTTKDGKPFSPAGFTNWFREMCNEAGLPKGTSAHGLRKAACRRLAEAGCSANVIASISGHASLREVERYTKAADQARMARVGMDAITAIGTGTPTYKLK
jgi:integrase